ncbi:hypothetical protein Ddye_020914 [Dipteronia dyeriana]|uniref:HAT C-terminal dimerisation domain-containing protein n=1 Tax=Dipteronia dyeriana TaxID=168575 RepID=A0AAD9WVT8_9ROSI|nr:hypothetical protein Ddye_020914 [Dipteronia dyeriana]
MDSSSNNDVISSLGEEEEGNDTMEPMEANSRSNTLTESGQGRKRKHTSAVWSSFVIVGKNAQGKEPCKCKYCGKQYICEGTHGRDGLKEIDGVVHKVRESVKYARASQTRKQKFIECIKRVYLDSKRGLRQDIPTRWNSTYLMLDSAIYYRFAWTVLELADSNYKHCPFESEWENVEKLCKFLRHFYDTANLFSGTKYPTSNLYMPKDFDNNINGDIIDIQRTQLDLYLEERRLERSIDLNILDFWKGNEPRYSELAAMARDVLNVPISTVAFESTFSMGGRGS